eukprot:UN23790
MYNLIVLITNQINKSRKNHYFVLSNILLFCAIKFPKSSIGYFRIIMRLIELKNNQIQ